MNIDFLLSAATQASFFHISVVVSFALVVLGGPFLLLGTGGDHDAELTKFFFEALFLEVDLNISNLSFFLTLDADVDSHEVWLWWT